MKQPVPAAHIFFAGGGTGGHLYPGLAIARAIVKCAPNVLPHFIGSRRGIERDILPTTEFPFTLLDLHPLYRRRPWENWRTIRGAWTAWRGISALARAKMPDAVLGTGGDAAGVALAWAGAHGIPTLLHEPDSHPGLTTRLFAKRARAVYLGFPEAEKRLSLSPGTTVLALGSPIDPPPVSLPSPGEARRAWGFPQNAFVVLVTGGSQGAQAVNECVAQWVASGLPAGVHLIWSTGTRQADRWSHLESSRVRVCPYLRPIAAAYAAASMAVARAGAMSIAELGAWGIPSLLVPLPTAARDHQTYNARACEAAGGALCLPQRDLSVERLNAEVESLQRDSERRDAMRAAMLASAHPEAAANIARSVLNILGIPAYER